MTKLNESLQTANGAVLSNVQQSVTEQIVLDYFFHQELDSKLTEAQKSAFIATCIMTGLNPIKKEIYAIPRWDRQKNGYTLTTVTSYSTYIKRAARNPLYRGFKLESSGKGNDLAITCHVYVEGYKVPISATAHYTEYNANTHIWKTKPNVMLEKVAISRAMRWAFPEELESMPYTTEEMGDAVIVDEVKEKSSSKNENKTSQQQINSTPIVDTVEEVKVQQSEDIAQIEQNSDSVCKERWTSFQNWSKENDYIKHLTDEDIVKLNQIRIDMDVFNVEDKLREAMNVVKTAVKQSPTPEDEEVQQYTEDQTKEAKEKIEKLFEKYPGLDNSMIEQLQTLENALHPVEFFQEFETLILSEFKDYCKAVRKCAGGDMVFEKRNHKTGLARIKNMTLKNCDDVVSDWADIESKIKADEERANAELFLQGETNEPPF